MNESRKRITRWRGLALTLAVLATPMFLHCGSVTTEPDAEATIDGKQTPDGPVSMPDSMTEPDGTMPMPTPTLPASVAQTTGGGVASSESFRVELRIGAPQPMGSASSASYGVRMSTGSY